MNYFKRTDWGASAESPGSYANLRKGIVVHWNGPAMGAYNEADVPDIIASTYDYHVNRQSWADIAYNFSIDRFGRVWEGRGKNVRNAASGDTYANSNYTAVELLFGKGDPFTDAMKKGLVEFYSDYVKDGGEAFILGHRDVVPTECPGVEVHNFLQEVPKLATKPVVSTVPEVPAIQQEIKPVPEYIVITKSGSAYPVFANGAVRQDYTWSELNALIVNLKVPSVRMDEELLPTRFTK